MNIVLLGSFPMLLPLYHCMIQSEDTIFVAEQWHTGSTGTNSFQEVLDQNETAYFQLSEENLHTEFPTWLQKKAIDLVLVFGCTLKMPKQLFSLPKLGFVNIHFGKLPQNRGADPVFWSLKKQHKETAITVHVITKDWDAGAIIHEQIVPIIPGETYGMLHAKMSVLTTEVYASFLEKVILPETHKTQSTKGVNYYNRPNEISLTIDWEKQTADEIEFLINACNPKYAGAITYYQNAPIKIIEVAPVDTQPLLGKKPGEIVHAHPHEGLFVNCKYGKLLKINCISSDAGVLSGTKYVQMGARQGQKFTTYPDMKNKNLELKMIIN